MRCNVCGADNLEGAAYCEDCGARLPMGAAQPTREASQASVAPTPVVSAPVPTPVPPMEAATPPVAPPPIPASIPAEPAPTPVPMAPPAASGGAIACPACGAQNLPGVAFCEDCGASLSDAPSSGAAILPPVHYDAVPSVTPVSTAPVTQTSRPRLIHTSGREFPLEKDTILLGRRSPVDGIFPEVDLTDYDTDSYISRRHGRITRNDAGYVYEDLGSSNGSWVNGNKMQAHIQQPLAEGNSLRLGKTAMVVRLS